MSELHQALAVIQRSLKVPKGQRNDFGKYNYRSAEDILAALSPLLGQCVLTISDDIVMVGDRIYVKAIVKIQLGGESLEVSAFAREAEARKGMNSDQLTGATSSYARKYALNGMFCIDDTKDSDSMDNRQQGANKPTKEQFTVRSFMALDNDARNAAWPTLSPALQTAINEASQ